MTSNHNKTFYKYVINNTDKKKEEMKEYIMNVHILGQQRIVKNYKHYKELINILSKWKSNVTIACYQMHSHDNYFFNKFTLEQRI